MWAVVPIRSFADGKHRLSPVLEDGVRAALVECMFLDVLEVLVGAPRLDGVVVVTRDVAARARALELGVEVLAERSVGLNAALSQAADFLSRADHDGILVVPGDVPLTSRSELEQILEHHGEARALTLVPDDDGLGTNALACSPPDLLEFRFGPGSAQAHLEAGRRSGATVRTLRLPGFALDIDTAADLAALRERGAHTRSGRLLDSYRPTNEERNDLRTAALRAGGGV